MPHSTHQKLVVSAAALFRQKGFVATGVSDILERAEVPRGSLYHHFPGGKHDLAIAAAHWSSKQVLDLINEAFEEVRAEKGSFQDGAVLISKRIADIFESADHWDFSPVTSTLLDGNGNEEFKRVANEIFEQWQDAFVTQGKHFGMEEEAVKLIGDKLLMLLEGAWVISRAIGNAAPIRQAADFV